MAPRIKVTAILSCDPSWRGLAFILFVPSLSYKRSFLYDLRDYDQSKKYKHPVRTTNILQMVFNDMFQKEQCLYLVDKVIVESQHKTNMQVLSWLISSNMMARLGKASFEYISPLRWKSHFGIELTGSHSGNKAAAIEFVENNQNRLVASETVTEHNTADACLLLNTYLETTKNIIYKNLDDWSSMTEVEVGITKLVCPKCKNNSGVVRKCEDPEKKMYGKHFITCWWTNNKGQDNEKKCGNFKALYANVPKIVNGFVDKTWKVVDYEGESDEVVEEVSKPSTGTKRAAPAAKQPPAKKIAAAPPPVPTPGPNMPLTFLQFGTNLQKAVASLKEFNGERFDAIHEKTENLTGLVHQLYQQVGDIQNMLTTICNALTSADQDHDTVQTGYTDEQPQERLSQSQHVPPLPLEPGELDDISF